MYYFANKCRHVSATDLYKVNDPAWGHTANSDILRNPAKYATFPYKKGNLSLFNMPGQKLEFENDTFDFAFSFSSIEHFGSHEIAAESMREIERVLKKQGVACVSTELIINDSDHVEYFTEEMLDRYLIKSHNMKLIDDRIDYSISERTVKTVIDIENMDSSDIDIVYKHKNTVFIPVILFFRKE